MEIKFHGLTSTQVNELKRKYGENELIKEEKSNPLKKFIGVFKEPMFLLLVVTATLYFLLGEPQEGMVMLVFVIFVATITFVQEWKTEKTMNALKALTSPKVQALRDGKISFINSRDLVPGDIVYLSEGERIPADCEILEESNFSVDESVLTGESEGVTKVTIEEKQETNDYWKNYMLYAGTLISFGKCTARVVSIGVTTEYGKIGKAIREAKEEFTPLQIKINKLVKNLAIAGVILCVVVILASYFYNGDIINSLLAGISLAMAMIPEEFPVVLTVFLSMGAYRLAKKNTLMRKISAVETLGSTTILCVDKTGTITENRMSVRSICSNGTFQDSKTFNSRDLSLLMISACEKEPYDPMEKAIIEIGKKNIDIDTIYENKLVKKYAFDSKTKRMANVYDCNGKYYVAAKGSPETILPLCSLENHEKVKIIDNMNQMASKGLRVLALAEAIVSEIQEDLEGYHLTFKALIGLQDPPKEGVKEAIEECRKAGIKVVMITGDYSKTAMAIGEDIGLGSSHKVLTGEDIDNISDEELQEAVKECSIFSRVIPEHKMKIVKAFKANGEIVAMTGDGVNDAPALKSADIGIAMGKRGTEVAKEAAHMILMDDNFTTIVDSVEDGRRVYDNIRKAMVYIMIIHIPIAALALFAPICNIPQLLLPMHIMLLELIIDPTCSIVFEGEEAEPNIMDMPPRSPKESLLTKNLLVKVILQGATMFLAAFLPFHFMVDGGATVEYARSFSLVTLIVSNVVLVLVNRSKVYYLVHIFKEKGNKSRLLVNTLALVVLFLIIYVPFLQNFFKTEALDGKMLSMAMVLGFVAAAWWEIVKVIQNNKKKRTEKSQSKSF